MPLLPIDYSNTTIYVIRCNDEAITDCYVGSTTNFKNRKSDHKKACNCQSATGHNCKVYDFIRHNGGWENWSMIPLENFSCENSVQKSIREQHWITELKATLNSIAAHGKNYETKKKYNDSHKEKRCASLECGCGKKYTNHNKQRHFKSIGHMEWKAAQEQPEKIELDYII